MRTQHVVVDSLLLPSVAESGFPERKGDFRPLPRSLCTYARILCAVAPLRNLMVSPVRSPPGRFRWCCALISSGLACSTARSLVPPFGRIVRPVFRSEFDAKTERRIGCVTLSATICQAPFCGLGSRAFEANEEKGMHNNLLLYAPGFVAISGVSLHENNYISEIRIGRMCGSFAEQGQTSTIFRLEISKNRSATKGKNRGDKNGISETHCIGERKLDLG